jgi:hypothetical protein
MSGHWPPEWEDQEEEFPEGANQLDAEAEAQLSEVAAYLASVPVPVMPDTVETRISAALAVEAATRGGHAASTDASRTLDRKKARARVRRNPGGGGPRRFRPELVGGSLVVCLLLVGLGFALSLSHGGSSSSEAASSGGSVSSGIAAGSAVPRVTGSAPRAPSAVKPANAASGEDFVVTASGTRYQQATLAGQVRARLAVNGGPQESFGTAIPAPRASAASVAVTPNPALQGCVLHLTGGTLPRLVDLATYQGAPAYVIATSSRVWVVGLGCTAAKTELVTSMPLAGLPGISAP